MNKILILTAALCVSLFATTSVMAENVVSKEAPATTENAPVALPEIGKVAPAMMAKDTNGKDVDLSAYKGKIVVLEWTNNGCPFVKKHYGSKNMQAVQKDAADKDVVWISVVSSAPGKEGNVTADEANKITADAGAVITHKILDPDGKIGHAYGAKTTPHLFVIAADGTIAYMGAIDDQSSPDPQTVKGAKNYVRAAIDSLIAGTPVETAQTQPYGCGVKY